MAINNSTPLMSLSAMVLDTETTGLDAKIARIVQIGAVSIVKGNLDEAQQFNCLVNPQEEITKTNTAIHGISNCDVQNKKIFSEIVPEFEAFTDKSILIGHNIGYDLAVLNNEFGRAELPWIRPRSLDTLLLAQVANPSLANYSLETISHWLNLEVIGRHNAIGDALTTAHIFLAIIPILREKGIRSLGEAERASRSFDAAYIAHEQAGWMEPVINLDVGNNQTIAQLAEIDSYPYRHQVKDIMATPSLSAESNWSPEKLGRLLVSKSISSAFIKPTKMKPEFGIVTERDLMRALSKAKRGKETIGDIMSYPLKTISQDAFLYQAVSRMRQFGVRHLGVVNDKGEVIGALTNGDLLKQRADDAILLGDEFTSAQSSKELAALWSRIPTIARKLHEEQVSARDITAIISEELCALTRRASELAEARMFETGDGVPPVPYCVLILGSGGRGESLLVPDQDNAIIYQSGDSDGREDKWFERLATHISDILNDVGIPYCDGGVMASNSVWRHSASQWVSIVNDWVARSDGKDILSVDIFYDFRCVHGDQILADNLWQHAYAQAHQSPPFLMNLARSATRCQAPISLLGNIKSKNGFVEIKKQALLSFVGGARMLALRHDVEKHTTKERFEGILDLNVANSEDINNLIEAHEILLAEALEQQLLDIASGIPPSYRVKISRLSKRRRNQLRWALSQVDVINGIVGNPAGSF